MLVDSATRDAILFQEVGGLPRRMSDAALTRELTTAWLAYLRVRRGRT
jgi:hypothetical protein